METLIVSLSIAFFVCLFWPKHLNGSCKSPEETQVGQAKKNSFTSLGKYKANLAKECSKGNHDWREGWWRWIRGEPVEGFAEAYMASHHRWECNVCEAEEFTNKAEASSGQCAEGEHDWHEGWWGKERGPSVTHFGEDYATFHYLYVCRRCGLEGTSKKRALY